MSRDTQSTLLKEYLREKEENRLLRTQLNSKDTEIKDLRRLCKERSVGGDGATHDKARKERSIQPEKSTAMSTALGDLKMRISQLQQDLKEKDLLIARLNNEIKLLQDVRVCDRE